MNTSGPRDRSIESLISINGSSEAVWKALTDSEELTRWFPTAARVEPGAGGKIWFSWKGSYEGEATIEIWDSPRHLRTSYGDPSAPMTDEFTIETRGGTTTLRIVSSGFGHGASRDQQYECVRIGWLFEQAGLKYYLEHHRGTPRQVAWARCRTKLPALEVMQRLLGPGALGVHHPESLQLGESFTASPTSGGSWSGRVHSLVPGLQLVTTVSELNNALLRVEATCHCNNEEIEVWFWLSTYGLPAAGVENLESSWTQILQRTLA